MNLEIPEWRLPLNLAVRYRAWSFGSAEPPSGSLAYDTYSGYRAHVEWYSHHAQAIVRRLTELGELNWAAVEASEAEKGIVSWRDIGLGALQTDSDLVVHHAGQAQALAPWIRRSRDKYRALLRTLPSDQLLRAYHTAGIPVNRGKGWPFMMGDDVEGAMALLAIIRRCQTVAEIDEALASCAPILLPRCSVAIMRVQGNRRLVPAYALYPSGLLQTGMRVGPKVRKVAMCPFPYNAQLFGLGGLWNYMNGFIAEIGDPLRRAMSIFHTKFGQALFAGDLTTYDDTVSYETRELILEEFLKPVFLEGAVPTLGLDPVAVRLALEVFATYSTLPVLAPPSARDHGARLLQSAGRLQSGETFTALAGKLINRDRNLRRIHILGGKGGVALQGDDQYNWMPAGFDVNQWPEAELGFKEVISLLEVILMRSVARGHGVLTRMLALQKEERFEPEDLLLAAAAIASRYDVLAAVGVKHHKAAPHPMLDYYYYALANHPNPRVRLAAAAARLMDPVTRAEAIAARTSTKAVRSLEGLKDWAVDDGSGSYAPVDAVGIEWDDMGIRRIPFARFREGVVLPDEATARRIIREQSYSTKRRPR